MTRRLNIFKTIPALLLLLASGCAAPGVSYHDETMDFSTVRTVAVMPFANFSREQAASERVRDVFSTMLMATGQIYVIPPGEVARGIQRAGLVDPTGPSPEEVKKFAGITEVDAVVTGIIREYGEVRSGSSAANVISLSVAMMESETGDVVWSASTTQGGVGLSDRLFGGGGEPMDKVTREAVDDLLDKLFQ